MMNMTDEEIELMRCDICPDCKSTAGFSNGPRGGAGRNIFCVDCGMGFNVAYPRAIVLGERIGKKTDEMTAPITRQ